MKVELIYADMTDEEFAALPITKDGDGSALKMPFQQVDLTIGGRRFRGTVNLWAQNETEQNAAKAYVKMHGKGSTFPLAKFLGGKVSADGGSVGADGVITYPAKVAAGSK